MRKKILPMLVLVALLAAACTSGDDESADTTVAADAGQSTDTTAAGEAPAGGTLDAVKARGSLRCGVSGSAVAFSETQPDGTTTGFDADFCRAVAAAVLGDANAVEFRALTAAERFDVLRAGDVDVLFRNTTWTQSRDTEIGLDFGPTTYYDGQAVMGKTDFGFTEDSTLADTDGAVLCTNAGTTTEKNITEGAAQAGATIILETVETFPEALDKFKEGSCDLVTTDASGLIGNKITAERAGDIQEGDWVVFPRAPISKEPLGPAYRQNDSQWGDVINWTVYAMMIADELGVTSASVDSVAADPDIDPELARLFGISEEEKQTSMGLDADAFLRVIQQVGNYDEVFVNNLNPVGITRDGTPNARFGPAGDGGLIYAPPAR